MGFNTYPANPWPSSTEQAGSGGSVALPIASADKLGGVKVGNGLSIDSAGVLSADSQAVDYSTTEQATGQKWIDGKDIFVKVYHTDNLDNNTDVTLEADFGATKKAIRFDGNISAVVEGSQYRFSATHYASATDCAYVCVEGNDLIVHVRDNYSAYSGDFVVYYTKTEA